MEINITRVNDAFHMKAIGQSNVTINIDASPNIGGVDAGARPMELLLMSLGSCSAVDVIQILKKQKQEIESFNVTVEASRVEDQIPSVFKSIIVCFKLKGHIDEKKLKRAITLSKEKYCSVSAMLHNTTAISYTYELN